VAQVSLDASGEHQIAITPIPTLQQQHVSADADSTSSSPVPSAQTYTPNENGEHDRMEMESTHGGHLGKLQASLTKSAAFQLPPTPTLACIHNTQPASRPAIKSGTNTRPATGAPAAKHGRLGMLSDSLDASLGMQLPPTQNPAVPSDLEVQGSGYAVAVGAAKDAIHGAGGASENAGPGNAGYTACIRALLEGNDKKAALDCASLMVKYFINVQENPHEEKYRRVPKGNKAFKARVAACAGSAALLQARQVQADLSDKSLSACAFA
jgi:hypothetical protein